MTRLKRVRNRVVNNFFIRKLYSPCETAHKIILKLLITRHFSSTSRRYRDADFLRVARMTWRMLVGKVIDLPLCNLYLGDNSPNIYIYIKIHPRMLVYGTIDRMRVIPELTFHVKYFFPREFDFDRFRYLFLIFTSHEGQIDNDRITWRNGLYILYSAKPSDVKLLRSSMSIACEGVSPVFVNRCWHPLCKYRNLIFSEMMDTIRVLAA